MTRILKIDRALYEVDDETKHYRFLRRNPDWMSLTEEENEQNKRQLDGYVRSFRDGTTRAYRHKG